MKKSFKIGEYVVGGIIQVEIKERIITIRFLDYYTKKVVMFEDFLKVEGALWDIDGYICDNGTAYYANKVCDWIKINLVD